jgi:hypothetical protein
MLQPPVSLFTIYSYYSKPQDNLQEIPDFSGHKRQFFRHATDMPQKE